MQLLIIPELHNVRSYVFVLKTAAIQFVILRRTENEQSKTVQESWTTVDEIFSFCSSFISHALWAYELKFGCRIKVTKFV